MSIKSLKMVSLMGRQSFRRYSMHLLDENALKAAEKSQKMWEKMTFFVAIPAVAIACITVYMNHHEHERPEFIPYDHLRIRTKKFPWGDGNHTLFHNPKLNALPDGYEE